MIRVLQILHGIDRGGMETFVMNIYRAINRSQYQFDFLINSESGDYYEEIKSLGGKIYYIPARNKGLTAFRKNLDEFFKGQAKDYNAVHYHESSLTSLEPLYYAKKYGIPIRIMHSHNSQIRGNNLHYITHFLGKFAISHLATHFYGCSDKALDWMYKYTGVRDKAIMINNGIDVFKFKYDQNKRVESRKTLGCKEDDFIIGHVGRFAPAKNHTYLIDIFRELLKIDGKYKLLLIGVGDLQKDIKEKAKREGVYDSTKFLGLREDTDVLYQAMDVFVMPSFFEGLPVVLVEAQASGLPIICSDRISKMSKMSDNLQMLSISESPQVWASTINETHRNINRSNAYENIIKYGYDINTIASNLCETYSGQV